MTNDPLGLSALTDDQLVEMARHLGAEINRRNPAVGDAATAAIREEIERAKASADELWVRNKWLATMAAEAGASDWLINVWRARDRDETRVYFESPISRRGALKYCYWLTGSRQQPPGTLTIEHEGRDAKRLDAGMVKTLCRLAAETFPGGARIDCAKALRTEYAVPPMPEEWSDARAKAAARDEEEKRKAARSTYYHDVFQRFNAKVRAERQRLTEAYGIKRVRNLLYKNAAVYDDVIDAPVAEMENLKALQEAAAKAINDAMAEYDARIAGEA